MSVDVLRCFNVLRILIWLVVWTIFFPYIGNVIIPTDELRFFRGVGLKPPTRLVFPIINHILTIINSILTTYVPFFFLQICPALTIPDRKNRGPGVWPAFWFLNSDRPWPSGNLTGKKICGAPRLDLLRFNVL